VSIRSKLSLVVIAAAALTLSACGSASFRHSPTPENLRACLRATVKPRGTVDLSASDAALLTGARAAVEFDTGGPYQQGGADYEAPLYSTKLYLFETPAAARTAASTIRDQTDYAHYAIGRAVVVDDVAFITAVAATLPHPTQTAIRSCLGRTGYLT